MQLIIEKNISSFDHESQHLVLDLRRWCGTRLRISTWDHGLDVERERGGRWWPSQGDPGLSLINDLSDPSDQSPLDEWASTIPEDIRELAQPFKHHQLLLLRLLQRSSHAVFLARISPSLLLLVADSIDQGQISEGQALTLIQEHPREILLSIGCIGSEDAFKMLQKFDLKDLDETMVEMLRQAMGQPYTIQMLRFHRDISPEGLRYAIRQNPLLKFHIPVHEQKSSIYS